MTIKVMVVDDSAVVRQVIGDMVQKEKDMQLIGAASDPIFAMDRMRKNWPDVIILDIEMPRMDGITFLRQLMAERPTPVVICSSLTTNGAETTIQALSAGAVGVVTKPELGVKAFLQNGSAELAGAIREAAVAKVGKVAGNAKPVAKAETLLSVPPKLTADAVLAPLSGSAMVKTTETIIAIGTSTGGTQALELVLQRLPRTCAGIVVVQHMPEKFTASFAARLDSICQIRVKEAENNDRITAGKALIAPGGKHMMVKRSGAQYYVEIIDGPLVSRHRPSVDVLFRSVAKYAGKNAIGVIMTGMGDDGAKGIKEMHDMGAVTIAQDEDSCVVFGMPREAIKLNAIDHVEPLEKIADRLAH
ncbi:MAG TPA: chemotaxis response regulator protein-glutamate methylesterase [Pseudomonadales bacterium]|nr:chemotaxis response regulator protein-glutamate methylesterase [Pseudomonadales bacterium]